MFVRILMCSLHKSVSVCACVCSFISAAWLHSLYACLIAPVIAFIALVGVCVLKCVCILTYFVELSRYYSFRSKVTLRFFMPNNKHSWQVSLWQFIICTKNRNMCCSDVQILCMGLNPQATCIIPRWKWDSNGQRKTSFILFSTLFCWIVQKP